MRSSVYIHMEEVFVCFLAPCAAVENEHFTADGLKKFPPRCFSAAALDGRRLTFVSEARASMSQESTRDRALRANHGAPRPHGAPAGAANRNASPAPKHPPTARAERAPRDAREKFGVRKLKRSRSAAMTAAKLTLHTLILYDKYYN